MIAAYEAVLDSVCPRCEAQPGEYCTNPRSGQTAHMPCIERLKS